MLDAEGYPPAFVKVGPFRLEFTRASRRTNHIHADVKIIDKRTMKEFKIGNHTIGRAHKPFIIAEMSGNHNQSLERAPKLWMAAKSGAHMLKLQTYTSDTMTLDVKSGEFFIEDQKSLERAIICMILQDCLHAMGVAPADYTASQGTGDALLQYSVRRSAVDFLADLDVPAYKIASFENADLLPIRKVVLQGNR